MLTSRIDEIINELDKQGKVHVLTKEESNRIDDRIMKDMIKVNRISETNQVLSERESSKIIFNF